MNKQPFYHRAVILFTATRDIPRDELEQWVLQCARTHRLEGALHGTFEVEECDSEPGDPADLM